MLKYVSIHLSTEGAVNVEKPEDHTDRHCGRLVCGHAGVFAFRRSPRQSKGQCPHIRGFAYSERSSVHHWSCTHGVESGYKGQKSVQVEEALKGIHLQHFSFKAFLGWVLRQPGWRGNDRNHRPCGCNARVAGRFVANRAHLPSRPVGNPRGQKGSLRDAKNEIYGWIGVVRGLYSRTTPYFINCISEA